MSGSFVDKTSARQAQVQAAADQKRTMLLAEEGLEVQKRIVLIAENEYLKAQIISNFRQEPGGGKYHEVVTVKVAAGYVVAVARRGGSNLLWQCSEAAEYSVEHINTSLHLLHKFSSERMGKRMGADHDTVFV